LPPQGCYDVILDSFLTAAYPHITLVVLHLQALTLTTSTLIYLIIDHTTLLTVLIFAEGGKPENPEKNPRGMRENNT